MKTLKYILMIIFIICALMNVKAQDRVGQINSPYMNSKNSFAAAANNVLYFGTWGDGIYKSVDEGGSWTPMSNGLSNKYINCIRISKTGILYACTNGGGLFSYDSSNKTWSALNNGINNLFVKAVAINDTGHIFVGTRGNGVYRSKNNGVTFEELNSGLMHWDINALIISKVGWVIAGTKGGGIWRSTDNGSNWIRSSSGLSTKFINDFTKNSVGDIYTSTQGKGVYYSADHGLSWVQFPTTGLTDLNISAIAFDKNYDLVVGTCNAGSWFYDSKVQLKWRQSSANKYGVNAIVKASRDSFFLAKPSTGIQKSSDQGRSWTPGAIMDDNKYLVAAFKNGLMFATNTGAGYYRSTDYGYSWQGPNMTNLIYSRMAMDSNGVIYAACDLGFYKSTDKGINWTNLASVSNEIRAISVGPGNRVYIFQYIPPPGKDSPPTFNILMSSNSGASWVGAFSTNQKVILNIGVNFNGDVYGIGTVGYFIKSDNNGVSWTSSTISQTDLTTIDFDSQENIYLSALDGIYKSTDYGTSWFRYTLGYVNPPPNIARVFVTNNDYVYAYREFGNGFYVSKNGGIKWDTLSYDFNNSYIRGICKNYEGDVFFWTDVLHRIYNGSTMPVPVNVYVKNDSTGVPLKPGFKWNPAAKAEMYVWELATDLDFTNVIETATIAATTYTVFYPLNYETEYYWHVRSKVDASVSEWSTDWKFTTIVGPPLLKYPVNNTRGIASPVLFGWWASNGASTYQIQVATDSLFAKIVADSSGIKDTTFTKNLAYYTKFYWRVRSKAKAGTSPWSVVWSFKSVVAAPRLLLPANNSKDIFKDITFLWERSIGAQNYTIEVAKKYDFSLTIFSGETETDTSHSLFILDYDSQYYWRIQASDSDGTSIWSEIWNFTTAMPPPKLTLPEDSAKNCLLLTEFVWDSLASNPNYHIQVATNQNFTNLVFEDSTVVGQRIISKPLRGYTQYYWRVRGKTSTKKGNWSSIRTFTTGLIKQVLKIPLNDATDQSTVLYLRWDINPGAQFYRLQITTDPLMSTFDFTYDSITSTEKDIYNLLNGKTYYWHVQAFNKDGVSTWSDAWRFTTRTDTTNVKDNSKEVLLEIKFYPNPFTTSISISYKLIQPEQVKIELLNLMGESVRKLCNVAMDAGYQTQSWQLENIESGTYLCKMNIGDKIFVNKVVCIK
ncbi:MAG: C-terminal target protein [Ignavibacteria bacterium]|nr:C-terminal target protein [Ignavibacteria bacterium]